MIAGSVPLQIVVWRVLAHEKVPYRDRDRSARRARRPCARRRPGRLRRRLGGDRPARDAGRLAVMVAGLVRVGTGCRSLPTPSSRPSTKCSAAGSCSSSPASWRVRRRRSIARRSRRDRSLAWAYLAVFGSVVGFSAYAWLLGNAPISQVVTHQYVNPLVAVALGALPARRATRPRDAGRRRADRCRGRGHGALRGRCSSRLPHRLRRPRLERRDDRNRARRRSAPSALRDGAPGRRRILNVMVRDRRSSRCSLPHPLPRLRRRHRHRR